MPKPDKIVTLRVTNWAYAFGGEHFTGVIDGYGPDGKPKRYAVTRKISQKDATYFNKKDGVRGMPSAYWKRGMKCERFWTRADVHMAAIQQFRKAFLDAIVLNLGQRGIADAQPVLAGPEPFMSMTNEIVRLKEKCGGYERSPKKAAKLFRDYQKLVKTIEG